jgi:hypothetical protein
MSFVHFLLGKLIETAYAEQLDNWGSANGGVQAMWAQIRATLYTRQDPVQSLMASTILFIFPLIGVAAVIIIIYAGIRIVSSQGKEDVVSEAKNMIFYACIGVILSIMATAIVGYFANVFFPTLYQ